MTDSNPFEAHGYHPALMDVAVQALKRGRNGQSKQFHVALGGVIVLGQEDREAIACMVDSAVGEDSARSVAYGILGVILPKLET